MKNTIFNLLFLFIVTGCASKVPITWEERVLINHGNIQELAYTEYGTEHNKTLLFLHGFAESRYTWRFISTELSKKYHVVMVDLKGFGDSPKIKDDFYSVYDQAHVVANFIEKKKLKNITLVGRSFGGGVALILALIQKEHLIEKNIEKLVLINSMSYKQNLPSMMEQLKEPVIGYLAIHLLSNHWIAEEGYRYAFYNNDLIPKESVEQAAKHIALPNAKYVYLETVHQLIPEDLEKIEKKYNEIMLPVLVLWGKDDVSISVRNAYRLYDAIPNSHLKVFPRVGHMPQEEVPEQVIDEIQNFMEENELH